MKILIICSVPPKIQYSGKILSLNRYQNTLSQSDCRIFKSSISSEQINGTNSKKLKVAEKFFVWAWPKYGRGQFGLWTLKLTVSQK